MALIAIDMTPVLPRGENGGVKLLALELIRRFQTACPCNRYLILTAFWNHDELAAFDTVNTSRLCVIREEGAGGPSQDLLPPTDIATAMLRVYSLLPKGLRNTVSTLGLRNRIEQLYRLYRLLFYGHHKKRQQNGGFLAANGADVLFCPFTAPTFAEPGVPVVSLVCDLQHRDYPQFFSPTEINNRESFFDEVHRKADIIVCISDYTRQSVIKHFGTSLDRTVSIPICIQSRFVGLESSDALRHLTDLGVCERPYMFYPANFWPHKNHQMLITAYGMYLSRNPEKGIDLVLTGALDDGQKDLKDRIKRMGLEHRVHFLGYLAEDQLVALWNKCSFLIFPSLYEGFGIPILEAMQFGKPALCSNVTSLPEVAGDAAIYFDPRKPHEILQCLERITLDPILRDDMVKRGYARLQCFQAEDMVNKYLKFIETAINSRPC